jgi:hypothetical protein
MVIKSVNRQGDSGGLQTLQSLIVKEDVLVAGNGR